MRTNNIEDALKSLEEDLGWCIEVLFLIRKIPVVKSQELKGQTFAISYPHEKMMRVNLLAMGGAEYLREKKERV